MIRILVIIAARNEENYINYSLKHFIDQNILIIILLFYFIVIIDLTFISANKHLIEG